LGSRYVVFKNTYDPLFKMTVPYCAVKGSCLLLAFQHWQLMLRMERYKSMFLRLLMFGNGVPWRLCGGGLVLAVCYWREIAVSQLNVAGMPVANVAFNSTL